MANKWLLRKNVEFLNLAIAFQAQAAPFPPSFFKAQNVKASTWWRATPKGKIDEKFIEIMIQLHSACASSASIERIFSNFGQIHNRIRNRLGLQKTSKLVFCYRMLRGDKEEDY